MALCLSALQVEDTIEIVVFDKYFAPKAEIRFGYTYQTTVMCETINNVRIYMGMSSYTLDHS